MLRKSNWGILEVIRTVCRQMVTATCTTWLPLHNCLSSSPAIKKTELDVSKGSPTHALHKYTCQRARFRAALSNRDSNHRRWTCYNGRAYPRRLIPKSWVAIYDAFTDACGELTEGRGRLVIYSRVKVQIPPPQTCPWNTAVRFVQHIGISTMPSTFPAPGAEKVAADTYKKIMSWLSDL